MIKNKGFTLIELLISLIIFSFMIAIAAYSFKFYIDLVKKIMQPYPKTALNFTYLEDAIEGMFFYTIEETNSFGQKYFYIYFKGEKNYIEFITDNFENKDSIFLCKLFKNQNGDLILEGSNIYSKYNNYKNPTLMQPIKIVLLKNVESLKIQYFINDNKTSILYKRIPTLIKIHINKKDGKMITLYSKIKSNFSQKANLTFSLYEPGI